MPSKATSITSTNKRCPRIRETRISKLKSLKDNNLCEGIEDVARTARIEAGEAKIVRMGEAGVAAANNAKSPMSTRKVPSSPEIKMKSTSDHPNKGTTTIVNQEVEGTVVPNSKEVEGVLAAAAIVVATAMTLFANLSTQIVNTQPRIP